MNNSNKGALTAIVATVITSVMILMSEAGNADNKQSAMVKDKSISIEETTVEIIVNDSLTEEVNAELVKNVDEGSSVAESSPKTVVLPPPGPFAKSAAEILKKPQSPQSPSEPLVPKAPKEVIEKPARLNNASVAPKLDKAPEMKSGEINNNNMLAKKPVIPFAPEIRSLKPELKKSQPLQSNKISLQPQKPKAPVAPEGQNIKKDKPKTQQNVQPIWMQMPDKNSGVRYMQQYRFVPLPVYPNYQFPQQPQLNSAYYSAPVSNQWMQQGMKLPRQNQNAKKNHAEINVNGSEGSSK